MDNMDRRDFLRLAAGCMASVTIPNIAFAETTLPDRPNVLLITADDMNWDGPGCFGCETPDITPNIDKLASQGIRFTKAHITCAVCMPSREVLMTGRYPHRSGGQGFEPIRQDVPTLQEQLHNAGYLNGILGKTGHLEPRSKFHWDMIHDANELGEGRDPKAYYKYCREFFGRAKSESKPFFMMANSHDPHRPYHGSDQERDIYKEAASGLTKPSRIYKPEEIEMPGFLPDIPDVRREVAEYYSSVRRCDDTVGETLRALDKSGMADNTLVMFLSDNGISMPYAKTNCYLNSTRTPWIARWPKHIRPGTVNAESYISGIDYMPTILDICGLKQVAGMDGRSFMPLLEGKRQNNRDRVFTVFHSTSSKNIYPMRCIQDRKYGYIYNSWADGKTEFKNESQSGRSMRAMRKAAESDPAIAERVNFFLYRCPEELYDLESDPNALHNLAGDPKFADRLKSMRRQLKEWMVVTEDWLLPAYDAFQAACGVKR